MIYGTLDVRNALSAILLRYVHKASVTSTSSESHAVCSIIATNAISTAPTHTYSHRAYLTSISSDREMHSDQTSFPKTTCAARRTLSRIFSSSAEYAFMLPSCGNGDASTSHTVPSLGRVPFAKNARRWRMVQNDGSANEQCYPGVLSSAFC